VNTWKPILAALLIFAAGVVTGGLTVRLKGRPWVRPGGLPTQGVERNRPAPRSEAELRELAQRLQKHLKLSPEQRERVETIVNESRERMKAIAEEMAPRTREEFRRMRERIRAELTPGQRQEFEEIFKQRDGWRRREAADPAARPGQSP
jgi:hypothetical protein